MNSDESKSPLGVDRTLVAMYLRMSIEERLSANDNAVCTIQELRDAFRRREGRAEPDS